MSRRALFAFLLVVCFGCSELSATPAPRLTIPFRAVGSTVLLPVSVNGSPPGWFILDSGGNSCVIDTSFARRLGLHPTTEGEATGAGKGSVPYDRYQESVRLNVAGLPFDCPQRRVIGLDLSNQASVIGTAVDGVLGTDFFSTYVVEIDYSGHVVRAFDPSSFSYTGKGAHIPLTIDDHRLPHIDAVLTVNGKRRAIKRLLVDSGSQDAVDDDWILHSRNLRTATGGVGIGKPFQIKVGRFSAVRIGPFTLVQVPGGAGGVPLVGGEVLRHFTVIFDWPRKQLIMEPSAGFARSLDNSGAAGMELRAQADGTATVEFVSEETPAARAGLRAGDVILAVDGTAAGKFQFDQLSELFRRNRTYRIEVMRAGKSLTIHLQL